MQGPASFNNISVTTIVISGVNSGLFEYTGTPALGNPPVAWAVPTGITTDPFGNVLPRGGGFISQNINLIAQLAFGSLRLANLTFPPANDAQVLIGAVAATGQELRLTSGNVSVSDTASTLGVFSGTSGNRLIKLTTDQALIQSAAGAALTASLFEVQGGVFIETTLLTGTVTAIQPGTSATAETWHSLGTLANYTVGIARYRLTPEGECELDIAVTSSGLNAAATAFSVTVPAAYRLGNGLSSTAYPLASNRAVAAGDSIPRVVVASTGVIQVLQTASVNALLTGQAFVPTN